MYLLSIASTTKTIRLQAAYFVPDDLAIETFVSARQRGVEICEYQPTMYHSKVIIVDDVWVSVGSTNFDDRSFRLNDEANLNIYDAAFAAEQIKVFDEDKAQSRLMTRAEFKNRSLFGKFPDKIEGLSRGQL